LLVQLYLAGSAMLNGSITGSCSQARKIDASEKVVYNLMLVFINCMLSIRASKIGCHKFCTKQFHSLPVANGQVTTLSLNKNFIRKRIDHGSI